MQASSGTFTQRLLQHLSLPGHQHCPLIPHSKGKSTAVGGCALAHFERAPGADDAIRKQVDGGIIARSSCLGAQSRVQNNDRWSLPRTLATHFVLGGAALVALPGFALMQHYELAHRGSCVMASSLLGKHATRATGPHGVPLPLLCLLAWCGLSLPWLIAGASGHLPLPAAAAWMALVVLSGVACRASMQHGRVGMAGSPQRRAQASRAAPGPHPSGVAARRAPPADGHAHTAARHSWRQRTASTPGRSTPGRTQQQQQQHALPAIAHHQSGVAVRWRSAWRSMLVLHASVASMLSWAAWLLVQKRWLGGFGPLHTLVLCGAAVFWTWHACGTWGNHW